MSNKLKKGYVQLFPELTVKESPLMTKQIEEAFKKSPLYSHEGDLMEADVITAYYTPFASGRWVIIEGEKMKNGDFLLYGYCHLFEWEWGTLYLSDLQRCYNRGIYIERDLHCKGKKVKDLLY